MIIYLVVNKINKKKYIGQTTRTLSERRTEHLKPSSKSCLALKSALDKYGRDSFKFHILQKCNSIEELNEREIYWVDRLKTVAPNGYNLEHGGGNTGLASDITKKKMSDNYKNNPRLMEISSKTSLNNWSKPEYREHISECRKKTWKNEEYRKDISQKRKDMWKSSEHREKIKTALSNFWSSEKAQAAKKYRALVNSKLKSKKVQAYTIDGIPFLSLFNMNSGSDLGFNRAGIRRSCVNGTMYKGYTWRYV